MNIERANKILPNSLVKEEESLSSFWSVLAVALSSLHKIMLWIAQLSMLTIRISLYAPQAYSTTTSHKRIDEHSGINRRIRVRAVTRATFHLIQSHITYQSKRNSSSQACKAHHCLHWQRNLFASAKICQERQRENIEKPRNHTK